MQFFSKQKKKEDVFVEKIVFSFHTLKTTN